MRAGKIPPPPAELLDEEGNIKAEYKITYISPLAKAQRMIEAQSINDFLGIVGAINEIAPMAVDNINIDKTIKRLSDIYNVPADILNSDDDVKAIREIRQQAQEQQRQLDMLSQGAEGAEKATRAEKNLKEAVSV